MGVRERIERKLQGALSPEHLEVMDDTGLHKGHVGASQSEGGHFSVIVVTNQFTGLPLLERHQAVYKVLEKDITNDIHALAIQALTLEEWEAK